MPVRATARGAAGPTDSQPQFLELDTGVVAYAVPGLNAYYVIPSNTLGGVADPLLEVAFAANGPCTKYGTTVVESYQPGTMVVMARIGGSAETGQLEGVPSTVIIGSVPRNPIIDSARYPNRPLMPGVGLDYYTFPFATRLRAAKSSDSLLRDRSYGRPLELLAGEWAATSDFLAHALVGHTYVSFGAGRARTEAHALHNRLRLLADDLRCEGMGMESASRPDLAAMHYSERRARNILEGLGSVKESPFEKGDDGKWKVRAPDQQGIFRSERYEGELVDGIWNTLQMPERAAPVRKRSDPAKPPFGVGSEQAMYDGTWERRAARQLSLVKSAYVPVPRELKREDDTEEFPDEEQGASWQEANKVSEEDYPNAAPAAQADEFDHNTAGWWRKRLRARTDNWKVYTPEEIQKEYGLDLEARRKLESLPESTQDYALPPVLELEDPATGRKALYYAAESFCRLLPDGSISIGDGYGAEIRMVRGRMVLSAPGDIELRPGRDLSVMAPRHAAINAGDSLFMQAANGSAWLKAQEDLSVLAGNSGKGRLLLESRGTGPVDSDSKAAGSGIVMKSASDLAITGMNIYLGVGDADDRSTAGLKRTKSGTILVDACGGLLGLLGNNLYGSFATSATLAVPGQGGSSAMVLSQGSMALYGSSTYLGTANIVANVPAGTATLRTLGVSGVTGIPLSISGQTSLRVGGPVYINGAVQAKGSIRAKTVNAAIGLFANATKEYSCKGSAPTIDFEVPEVSTAGVASSAAAFAAAVAPADHRIYTGIGLALAGFGWPSAEAMRLAGGWRLHGMRWQAMLQGPAFWNEPEVKDPAGAATMFYPGLANWAGETFFMGTAPGAILKQGYPINATQ